LAEALGGAEADKGMLSQRRRHPQPGRGRASDDEVRATPASLGREWGTLEQVGALPAA